MIDAAAPPLEAVLGLERLDAQRFRSRVGQGNRNGMLYGGVLIAQAFEAVRQTLPAGIAPQSLQVTFQGPTDIDLPVVYEVESTRDGATLTTRRVVARQGSSADRPVLFVTASCCRPTPGYEHAQPWSEVPPSPESLPTLEDLRSVYGDSVNVHALGRLEALPQVDLRLVNPEVHLLLKPSEPRSRFWIRARMSPDRDRRLDPAALAFLSDYLLVNAALLPHVNELPAKRLFVASLNHTLWLNDAADATDWLLYETQSPWARHGTGLVMGRLYARDGRLVASSVQEALVRIPGSLERVAH